MAIFAVLSVMAYGGLEQVMLARDKSDRVMERLAELQLTWALIGRDLEQAAARPIRDGFGDPQPALVVGGDSLLEFTRGGWPNPLRRPRGYLQRVAWAMDGEILQRYSWNVLDRAQDSEPRIADILTGVTGVELRFMDQRGEWSSSWPSADGVAVGAVGQAAGNPLPRGIEVTLELEDIGDITRLFQISEWQPPPQRARAGAPGAATDAPPGSAQGPGQQGGSQGRPTQSRGPNDGA